MTMTRRQFLARSALCGTAAWLATSTAANLRGQLHATGLRCPSLHFDGIGFEPGIEAAHTLGAHYIVSSMLPAIMQKELAARGKHAEQDYSLDGAKRTAEYANRLGEKAKQAGLQYAYHNHHLEFSDVGGGQTFYDVLLKETQHDLVQFELDCGWVHMGGKNPADYFNANPGRMPLMHAKDFLPGAGNGSYPGSELGRGTLDYQPIMAAADRAGLKHCFVEQEGPFSRISQLDAARIDYDYLRPWR